MNNQDSNEVIQPIRYFGEVLLARAEPRIGAIVDRGGLGKYIVTRLQKGFRRKTEWTCFGILIEKTDELKVKI
jgi:hypothetical protein